jgi:hypothetical protein
MIHFVAVGFSFSRSSSGDRQTHSQKVREAGSKTGFVIENGHLAPLSPLLFQTHSEIGARSFRRLCRRLSGAKLPTCLKSPIRLRRVPNSISSNVKPLRVPPYPPVADRLI